MKELLNQKVKKIEINAENDSLVFITDKEEFVYNAWGDCCSITWFSHIAGIKNLLGQTVTKVIEHKSRDATEEEYKEGNYDDLEIYGFALETKKGTCDIEFRNDSNGYYGGDCDKGSRYPKQHYKEVTTDF